MQRTSSDDIRIEPAYAAWEQQELAKVTCLGNAADALAGTAFGLPGGTHYAYLGIDPAIAGKTGIEYTAASGATPAQVATAIATALKDDGSFNAAVDPKDPTSVYIQAKAAGAVAAAEDIDSGHTIERVREGASMQLGLIDGDITVGLTENLVDVTAHQTGAQIIQSLRNGRNIANIAIPMKEAAAARLKQIIEASGVEYTPAGDGATPVSAWGSEDTKSVGNISGDCRKLVLHPVRRDEADLTEDMCFFRAYPLLQGVVLSGENPRMINVEFKIIPDGMLVKEARQFVFGDHSQNFLAE